MFIYRPVAPDSIWSIPAFNLRMKSARTDSLILFYFFIFTLNFTRREKNIFFFKQHFRSFEIGVIDIDTVFWFDSDHSCSAWTHPRISYVCSFLLKSPQNSALCLSFNPPCIHKFNSKFVRSAMNHCVLIFRPSTIFLAMSTTKLSRNKAVADNCQLQTSPLSAYESNVENLSLFIESCCDICCFYFSLSFVCIQQFDFYFLSRSAVRR